MIPLGYRRPEDRPELPAWVLVFAGLSAVKAVSALALLTYLTVLAPDSLDYVHFVLIGGVAFLFAILAVMEAALALRHPASLIGVIGGGAALIWILVIRLS
jgi:hypothetical protein